jgi:Transposase DDE domain
MMTTEDTLILLFCTIDDWLRRHPVPRRPGPRPACSDSEILTFALARELLSCPSERRFLRELRHNWRQLFPCLPAQSELNRRTRWLQGALELLRRHWLPQLASASSTLLGADTTPLPVMHRSRVKPGRRGHWDGPDDLSASFGKCAAKKEWFYGFRLAAVVSLSDGIPRQWALVPASVDERAVTVELLRGESGLILVGDRGLDGEQMRTQLAAQDGILLTPGRKLRRYRPTSLMREFVRRRRNRCERPVQLLKDRFALEQHRSRTFWGLLTRVMAKLAAATLRALWQQRGLVFD